MIFKTNKPRTIIELFREDMKFSAAHFTIFSEKNRETLHGHNFKVFVSIEAFADENDLTFDYTACRKKILLLCQSLNERCLMPANSKFLEIKECLNSYIFQFNDETLMLPKNDVILLPLTNITTEGLAKWFLEKVMQDKVLIDFMNAISMTVKISTAPGQYASVSKKFRSKQ